MSDRKFTFPDGIRFPRKDEMPGPQQRRDVEWARVEAANIERGFVLKASDDARFSRYAEVNVDAPHVWAVFRELCEALLTPKVTLVFGGAEESPTSSAPLMLATLLSVLEQHKYQLTHDGFIQFGILNEETESVTEVFMAPAKYLRVWLSDEGTFRDVMMRHGLEQKVRLEFLDEFPTVSSMLPDSRVAFRDPDEFLKYIETRATGLIS